MNIQLLADLRQRTHERDQLANVLATRPPAAQGEITADELLRRLKYVVNRARHGDWGGPICSLCESRYKNDSSLQKHLKRDHLDDLRTLPPEYFA